MTRTDGRQVGWSAANRSFSPATPTLRGQLSLNEIHRRPRGREIGRRAARIATVTVKF